MRNLTRGLTAVVAASVLASCSGSPTASSEPQPEPSFATGFVVNGVRGTGEMGSGARTFAGIERQWFDVDVSASGVLVTGRMEYIDYSFVKEDGRHPHLVVGAEWPGTGFLTFVPTSSACAEFTGVGYLINTGELLAFRVQTCDNGTPGAGLDTFGIEVPQRLITHSAVYRAGPFLLAEGELTNSGIATPLGLF